MFVHKPSEQDTKLIVVCKCLDWWVHPQRLKGVEVAHVHTLDVGVGHHKMPAERIGRGRRELAGCVCVLFNCTCTDRTYTANNSIRIIDSRHFVTAGLARSSTALMAAADSKPMLPAERLTAAAVGPGGGGPGALATAQHMDKHYGPLLIRVQLLCYHL